MFTEKEQTVPYLMNLSRVSNPPKTGFNWAPAQILKKIITNLSGTTKKRNYELLDDYWMNPHSAVLK